MRVLNTSKTSLLCTVDGISGADNIAELWQHYGTLFNCISNISDLYKVEDIESNV